jgi:hypothetical protein
MLIYKYYINFFKTAFALTFYRKMYLTYKEDTSVILTPTYRYTLPKSLLASPNQNPANNCNCRSPRNFSKCDGILDLESCIAGVPIVLSFPHFLHSSSVIINSVRGMRPNIEEHESYFDIEPVKCYICSVI